MPDTKICTTCKQQKSLDEFHANKKTRDGKAARCKPCAAAYKREYRARPGYKETMNAYLREWHAQRPGQRAEYNRVWRERHPEAGKEDYNRRCGTEALKANQRRYVHSEHGKAAIRQLRERRRELDRAYKRTWHEQHAETIRARVKAWRKANPIKKRISEQTRRARKAQSGGTYTEAQWLELCAFFDNRCASCGAEEPLTVDHVIPLARGGSNDIGNLQPLCRLCNCKKGVSIVDYRVLRLTAAMLASGVGYTYVERALGVKRHKRQGAA